jgi:hypothetical protein
MDCTKQEDNPMFRSFTIKNFRCFHDFTLDSLERVNLIAGQNNVGKTALLEGVFWHVGFNNPELGLRVNTWRGIRRFNPDPEGVWGSLFNEYDIRSVIELMSTDAQANKNSLQVYLAEPVTVHLPGDRNSDQDTSATAAASQPVSELILNYLDQTGQQITSRALVTADGVQVEKSPKLAQSKSGIFLGTHERFFQEDADRFSKLEVVNRQDEVMAILRILEPRLTRLAILLLAGVPVVHGDVGIGRLLPIPIMGEGMTRLLSIALAIANTEHGVVLIDEVENGLHHSVMTKVWTAIAQAARAADVQIFATTHSWECICAAHEAFSRSETYDFRLHRLDRADDDIQAVTLDQEMLDTAIKAGLEVR